MKRIVLMIMLGALLVLTACDDGATGEEGDEGSAQSFFPRLANYTVYETESVQDAIASALGGAGLLTGNVPQAVLIERIDSLLDCYRRTGAAEANIYIQNLGNAASEREIPVAGVLAVVNQNRAQENFLSCLQSAPFSPQSVDTPEPCTGSGTFEASNGDTIRYIYAASDTPLCTLFDQHFNQF